MPQITCLCISLLPYYCTLPLSLSYPPTISEPFAFSYFLSHHILRYHMNAVTKKWEQAEHQAMLISFRPLSMTWPRNNSKCQKDIYFCSTKCICYGSNIPLLQYFTWAFSMLKLYFQSQ